MVTFELFVRPALRRMAGAHVLDRPRLRARAIEPIANPGSRRGYLRVTLREDAQGYGAQLTGDQGLGDPALHGARRRARRRRSRHHDRRRRGGRRHRAALTRAESALEALTAFSFACYGRQRDEPRPLRVGRAGDLAGGCASRRAVDRTRIRSWAAPASELAEMRVAQEATSRGVATITSQLQSLDIPALGRDEVGRLSRRAGCQRDGDRGHADASRSPHAPRQAYRARRRQRHASASDAVRLRSCRQAPP